MFAKYVNLPRPIHILCLGTFINRAGSMMVPFLTIYLQDKLHLGEQFATLAMGCYGFGAIVAMLVGGHLADTIGRRTVMLISLVGGASILLGFGQLTNPWTILGAVVVFAMVADLYRPAASAMIADLVGPLDRPAAYGLLYVAINLGFTVGPSVGGILVKHVTFNVLFIADALTSLVYAVIIGWSIQESLPSRANKRVRVLPLEAPRPGEPTGFSESRPEVAPYAAATDTDRPGLIDAFAAILRDRVFLAFAVATLLVCLAFSQSLSTLPLFMKRQGIESDIYGRLISLNGLIIVLFQLPITAFTTRFHRIHMVSLAAVFIGLGVGLTALCSSWWHFALTILVWTAGEMLQSPYISAIVADLAPPNLRARYMGIFSMCYSSANMLGAPIGGWILAHHGGPTLWLACLACGLASAVAYAGLRRQITAHHAAATQS